MSYEAKIELRFENRSEMLEQIEKLKALLADEYPFMDFEKEGNVSLFENGIFVEIEGE